MDEMVRELGGPICSPSPPLDFSMNESTSNFNFEEDLINQQNLKKNELNIELPFLLSRFGIDDATLERLERQNKEENQNKQHLSAIHASQVIKPIDLR